MNSCFSLYASSCAIALSVGLSNVNSMPTHSETTVRNLLNGAEFKEERQKLIAGGEHYFRAYETILTDPKAKTHEVARIFNVIREVKADRSRFLEHAASALAHEDGWVRGSAVQLLADIGSRAVAAPIVALLSDGEKVADQVNAYLAAKALAALGGPREVIAMDTWLLGVSHRDDRHLRAHVKKWRDELEKRQVREVKPKGRAEKNVRELLQGTVDDFNMQLPELIQMGVQSFPSFEAILSDTNAQFHEVFRIFAVLRAVRADRRGFLDYTVRWMMVGDSDVRLHAVRLLDAIGSEAETSPLVALLSDPNKSVVNAAATTIAVIGGRREVIALDAWLLGTTHRDEPQLREQVKKCRDELDKRLNATPKAKEKR